MNSNKLLSEYTPSAEDIAAGLVTLTLKASNHSCLAASSSKTLTLHATPHPQVSGEMVVCAQTKGIVYSTPLTTGNTYEWSVVGGTIESGAGTSQVTVNWGSETSGLVTLVENTTNNCPVTCSKGIVINALPATVISGINTACPGEITTYSAASVPGNGYSWNISGGTITSGQGTHEVQVTWNTIGLNTISLTETILSSLCADTKNLDVTINGNAAVPAKPEGTAEVDLYLTGNSDYTVTPATYAQTYVWQLLPADAGIVSGNATAANVVWNSTFRGNATLTAKAVNNCGESTCSEAITVRVFSSLGLEENTGNIGLTITPNPNDGNFALTVSTPGRETLTLRITSATGSVVYERTGISSDGKFTDALNLALAQGTYNITVSTTGGYIVKKLVVTK